MDLSVVIPSHNRPELLRLVLAGLGHQDLSPSGFEVVLVDDGSEPPVRRELKGYEPPFTLRMFRQPPGGLASARNLGARKATGRMLLFLDDDVVPAPGLLREHLRLHTADERVVVIGALAFPPELPRSAFSYYLERAEHYDVYRNPYRYPGGWPPVPPVTGNTSVGRALFREIGGYDESFRRYGGEDLEFGYRLHRAGVRMVYHPAAFGHHHHLKNFDQFCRDMEAAGQSLIQVYRKYPEIRAAKKIDVVEDPFCALDGRKKIIKLILAASMASPRLMAAARRALEAVEQRHGLRHVCFPFYRWVSHYHYARGMQKGLAEE